MATRALSVSLAEHVTHTDQELRICFLFRLNTVLPYSFVASPMRTRTAALSTKVPSGQLQPHLTDKNDENEI